MIRTDEKGSDVNLATMLLVDAFHSEFDLAAVISDDSDLQLPVEKVRADCGKTVYVFYSPKRNSRILQAAANSSHPIRAGALQASQFPLTIKDQHGTITKPMSWPSPSIPPAPAPPTTPP